MDAPIKRPVGRPSAYKDEYPQMLLEFFDRERYVVTEDGKREANEWPTLARFSANINVSRDTINEWTRIHPEFSDAMNKAKAIQEDLLIQNAITGLYDKTFSIFAAKNVIGWRDRTEHEHTGGLTVQIVKFTDEKE